MISKDYTIIDQHGMHARPAAALLKLARQFRSEILLKKDDRKIPLKSMLNILSLSIKYGDTVTVIIQGEDELSASEALHVFFIEEMKKF
jgi:phosphocarrier protein HPr